jgi:hypothetical protein
MGLRQFEKSVVLDAARAVRLMRNLSQAAIDKFERFSRTEGVVASVVRILMALAVNRTHAAVHRADPQCGRRAQGRACNGGVFCILE